MKISYYKTSAGEKLSGRYCEGFFVVSVCILVYLIFKALDIAGTGAVLYENNFNVAGLYLSGDVMTAVVKILRYLICFAVISPLVTGGIWWFYQTAADEDNRSILKLYTGFRLNIRAALIYGMMWLMGMLSLLPSGMCWLYAYRMFAEIPQKTDQSLALFLSVQTAVLGIALLGIYLRCVLSFILSPFIFINQPDMGTFRVLRESVRKMKGAKLDFLALVLSYLPFMIPVVTIPFILPKAVMSAAVFARERIEG